MVMTDFEARLAHFKTLQRNWDSYDGEPTSEAAIAATRELIQRSAAEPSFIAPMPDGGVQVEWLFGNHELEVQVGPQGHYGYLLVRYIEEERAAMDDILAMIAKLRC